MTIDFNTVAKPGGNLCNLACDYCFYLHTSVERPTTCAMDDATLEAYIRNSFASSPSREVEFCWQGGEPTLCGLDFFARVIALQQRYQGDKIARNSLQTNGLLLNDKWAQFLKTHQFLVGLSVDGPPALHDAYRKSASGKPSYEKVARAIRCLQEHEVPVNAMVVVSQRSASQGKEIYHWLTRDLALQHLQFIPLVERTGQGGMTAWSVSPQGWGDFLCEVFDTWIAQDIGNIYPQLFDNLLGVWMGQPATLCTMQPTCGQSLLVEKNGDVYSCDHFVSPEYKLGNVRRDSLSDLASSPAQRQFGQWKAQLPLRCLSCHWRFACHGGCPKHRFVSHHGEMQNYLCEGYIAFFRHITPYMNVMRQLLLKGQPPARVMHLLPEIRENISKLQEQESEEK